MPSAAALLEWYDRHRRRMPWRALPGEQADPYRVWLSEIMLQQTTVAAVIPYYEKFLTRFPDVGALAAAEEGEVMRNWAGLGYYARARNLHACARAVAALGGFPRTIEGLRALPGIGPYTAAAIGAIAFGIPVIPVDGNVERVMTRVHAITTPLPAAKPLVAEAAARLAGPRPSDLAQALFDLGATICTPRPACALCATIAPGAARHCCRVAAQVAQARTPAAPRGPVLAGRHHVGRVLLRLRPPEGLLGGMTELPGTPWRAEPWADAEALAHAPMPAAWRRIGEVRHGFTHFELHLAVHAATVPAIAAPGFLIPAAQVEKEALPSVMMKCVRLIRPRSARTMAPPEMEETTR